VLTVNNDSDYSFSGNLGTSGANFGLTKGGLGKLTLSGTNSYGGDTIVNSGTLSITTDYLSDAADVYLATGAIFELNFAGTDTIDQLFIDLAGQASGTWGASGSGADHESPLFEGTGLLLVMTAGTPSADANGDGVVDSADYIIVKTHIGQATTAGPADGDFDSDGTVDWNDLQTLMNAMNAGGQSASPAIPEPATLFVMMAASLPALLKRRRSRRS